MRKLSIYSAIVEPSQGCIMPLQCNLPSLLNSMKFWTVLVYWEFPKVSLYFHRKEFRRINRL